MSVIYRPAIAQDSQAIAEVHVASWRSTYRGILPDELLANLSVEDRAAMWQRALTNPESQMRLVVALIDDAVVGFAAYGAARDIDDGCDAEIYALYVLSDHQRKGIGRQMVAHAAADFVARGNSKMLIGVLKDNAPARGFYQALGGDAVLEKPVQINGLSYAEIGYIYVDLVSLAQLVTDDHPST